MIFMALMILDQLLFNFMAPVILDQLLFNFMAPMILDQLLFNSYSSSFNLTFTLSFVIEG